MHGNELSKPILINDLIIYRYPDLFQFIEKYIESARQKGVCIGQLIVNKYIYENHSLCIVNYIKSLDELISVFRDLYDQTLHQLSLDRKLKSFIYNLNNFHDIFNEVNNIFNKFLDDMYLFEEFSIFQSQVSIETCIAMCETFNDAMIFHLKEYVDINELKRINVNRMKNFHLIYDRIFVLFEYVYLPFY